MASGDPTGTAPRRESADVIQHRKPLHAVIAALRPHQWAKNLLVFIPLLAVGAPFGTGALGPTLIAFLAFCLTASSGYIGNDLLDLPTDRRHPRKRHRPFAQGDLPVTAGLLLAPILLALGIAAGSIVGIAWLVLFYAALSGAYSLKLKKLPLVDVFLLAGFYTIRIVAGGVASGYLVSLWLLAFSSFVFLSLGLVKRVAELRQQGGRPELHGRRGYAAQDLQLLEIMGIASSFVSAMVLALYVQDMSRLGLYRSPAMLWLAVPLVLFWQCRLWLVALRGSMHDDPVLFAIRDRGSWLVAAALVAIVLAARLSPTLDGLVLTGSALLP
jgi:4-hydroxybenzoate polyprenyltransferase